MFGGFEVSLTQVPLAACSSCVKVSAPNGWMPNCWNFIAMTPMIPFCMVEVGCATL